MRLVERNGLLIPAAADVQEAVENLTEEHKCPAARITSFSDTSRPAIYCGVERNAFAVEDAPVAALGWCVNQENPGYHECPIWQAQFDDPEAVARTHAAQDQAEQDALTREQIRHGVRVDDRDQELEELEAKARRLVTPPKPDEIKRAEEGE